MRFHYDLSQAEPIVRDYPVYGAATILNGQAMANLSAVSTAANRMFMQRAAYNILAKMVGVTNETGLNATTSDAATGVTIYGKIIINPLAVWYAEYSQNASDDTLNTSADSTGKTITSTFTTDREGDWVYVTGVGSTTGGAGNLFQVGLSTDTTVVTACTSYDDNLKGTNTSDTFIMATAPFTGIAAGGSIDLSAQTAEYDCKISGVATTGGGAAITLANYIESASAPSEQVLRVQQHSGYNYPYASTRIYADLMFLDHMLLGGGVANFPVT